MSWSIYSRICNWCKNDKNRSLKVAAAVMVFLLGMLLLVMDYRSASQKIEHGLLRNDYGGGTKTEELQIRIDNGERKELDVEISEKMYEEEEVKELFQRCISKLEETVPGENESLDYVETDLNLVTELPGEPVEISWKLDHYEVMNIYGQIQKGSLAEEGTLVNMEAVITYTENQELQTLYQCAATVYPLRLGKEEDIVRKVTDSIVKENEETRTKESVSLPETIEGAEIEYYNRMDYRGVILMILACFAGILFFMQELQNRGKELEARKKQMLIDYPEIINKLTLFLGAGMNTKRAWRKIVSDYEAGKKIWGIRYAYEEMKQTYREMDSGVTEAECYERFGKRCKVQEYIRLGALLSQNIRKGTKGMNQVLKLEAVQAFENRKAYARKAGEEAGTKLLVPMFLMLAVVLVMVTIPAFLTMKI